MKTFSRLALAALLTGAVCLPALAQVQPVAPIPTPTPHVIHAATGSETVKPDAGKPDVGKPVTAKPAEKPAAMTGKPGSHATSTEATPPATGTTPPKTN